jgi:hypothetical protein
VSGVSSGKKGLQYHLQVSRTAALFDAFLWILALACGVAVVAFSLLAEPGDSIGLGDKYLHFIAYTGLTTSVMLAAVWNPVGGRGIVSTPFRMVLAVLGFGVVLEILQGLFFDRDADALDALVNGAGIATGLLLWWGCRQIFGRTD